MKKGQKEGLECEECRVYTMWKFKGTSEQKKRKRDELAMSNRDPKKRKAFLETDLKEFRDLKEALLFSVSTFC